MQYNTPGNYNASLTGTAYLIDQKFYSNQSRDPYRGGWSTVGSYTSDVHHSRSINASTQIHVGNLNPFISAINWNPFLTLGEDLIFSATANDPAGVAGKETLTTSYDFDGDGNYDFSQGGLTSGGSHLYSEAGIYTVGLRVTDGLGGVTFGSFDVEVQGVPEPASLAMWSIMGGIAFVVRRRRKKAVAI